MTNLYRGCREEFWSLCVTYMLHSLCVEIFSQLFMKPRIISLRLQNATRAHYCLLCVFKKNIYIIKKNIRKNKINANISKSAGQKRPALLHVTIHFAVVSSWRVQMCTFTKCVLCCESLLATMHGGLIYDLPSSAAGFGSFGFLSRRDLFMNRK